MKNITQFADIHTHISPGDDRVVSLSMPTEVPAEGFYSIGIHPWDAEKATEVDLDRLQQLAEADNVVAIGECGLDALRGGPLPLQMQLLRAQVAISERVGKPLIIHAVRTFQQLLELRRELRPTQRWIIHGFRGKPQLAQSLLRAGFDLSFGERYNPESYEITPPDRRFRESDEVKGSF